MWTSKFYKNAAARYAGHRSATTVGSDSNQQMMGGWMDNFKFTNPWFLTTAVVAGSIGLLPMFKTTREGMKVAYHWSEHHTKSDTGVNMNPAAWQFWLGLAGVTSFSAITGTLVNRAVRNNIMVEFFAPGKLPLMVMGGILGAWAATSERSMNMMTSLGRFTKFTVDGLQADVLGKPREKLAWTVSVPK